MSSASRVTYVCSGGTPAAASSSRSGASASPTGSDPTHTSRVPAACAAAAPSASWLQWATSTSVPLSRSTYAISSAVSSRCTGTMVAPTASAA